MFLRRHEAVCEGGLNVLAWGFLHAIGLGALSHSAVASGFRRSVM